MDLFKWTKNLKPKFPNVVEKFFGNKIDDQAEKTEEVASIPSVNISDKTRAFEVEVAVPGLDKKDIRLEIKNDCLIISSEKQYRTEDGDGLWMRREFGYSSFQRMFRLPENADPHQVEAKMKNGLLRVVVGKRKEAWSDKKLISVK